MRFDDPRHALPADELYARHGGFPLAYATLQPGLRYAHDDRGYIAYARSSKLDHRAVLVLGDPVCAADRSEGLLADFLARYPGALFVAAGERTAATLAADHARRRVCLGAELGVDPVALAGRRESGPGADSPLAADDRTAGDAVGIGTDPAPRAMKGHLEEPAGHVEELSGAAAAALRSRADEWLRERAPDTPERRFLTRPLGAPDSHQRWFAHRSADGSPEYLMVFDACRAGGAVSGYRASVSRAAPHASPPRAARAIVEHVTDALGAEGCRALWLGIAPPLAIESRADDFLLLGLLRRLIATLAADAADRPPHDPAAVPDVAARSPVYLVGRNGWGIEYVAALRDVSRLFV